MIRLIIFLLMIFNSTKEIEFNNKINFIANRLNTCYYRFHQILETRRREIPKIADNYQNEQAHDAARDQILGACDTYVNCLRNDYGELPEYLEPSVNEFKRKAYTDLSRTWVLQEEQRKVVQAIYTNRSD